MLTSILMTRPTDTECNHRSRSHYQTRDPRALTVTWVYQTRDPRALTVTWVYQTRGPRALTVTWVYQKGSDFLINRPMGVMLFTMLVDHILVINATYKMLIRRFAKLYITDFICMTCMFSPYHDNACHGGHGIYNFGRPFLAHHYHAYTY